MTTEIKGGPCEIPFLKPPWLRQSCVVNLLGLAGVDNAKVVRRLAPFPGDFKKVESGLKRLLAL